MVNIYKDYEQTVNKEKFTNFPLINSSKYLSQVTLPEDVCDNLIAMFNTFGKDHFYHVGVNGTTELHTGVGSKRVTNYDIKLAQYLTKLIAQYQRPILTLDEYSPVDWLSDNPKKTRQWGFEGVSPVFRYMEYTKGSEHFPHYDAPYCHPDSPLTRTLMSGVLYLTTNKSGATGFINDGQDHLPFAQRNTEDWLRQANLSEVESWQLPSKGRILIFPHQVCHTVFPLLEDEKRIIIRFDLFFKAYSL